MTTRQKLLYRYWRRAAIPAWIAIDLVRQEIQPETGNLEVDALIALHDWADA
ncbi:TPA: hypothetical protein QDB15_000699 [Burkholderia vietnamiensis]|uniref:hypothetical protein n=1 Tax=Burkholderia cepacia complex TaxID=87882 RepID=UPI001594CD29|nr:MULTISPECIES: hypothetical protein [Burkholderia cepacia complex]MCA8156201.1 hypothetical protein [Burkholderia contaminans]MCA8207957.1 hypothetical protein [Burkholderia vietnamiensis]HDR9098332.1 hypothetical protein [Burkholderia vietnamiensis]HDR9116967.1 hypothetical protein [Burkholderia vietnamiensis]HDR9166276.1 hypothetical protein [Burkholderia vietnamiensis]